MDKPVVQVDISEVKDLLENKPAAGGRIPLNLNPEDLGIPPAAETSPEEKTAVPPDPAFSSGDVASKLIAEHLKTPAVTEAHLQLTQEEKDIYAKALGQDEPVVWDIEIPGLRWLVRIRSRSNFEQSLVMTALFRDTEAKEVVDGTSHIARGQHYSAMFQLLSVSGKDIPHVAFDSVVCVDDAVAKMKATLPYYQKLSGPKWSLYLTALQIFEGKLALAASNVLNKDFFRPAG